MASAKLPLTAGRIVFGVSKFKNGFEQLEEGIHGSICVKSYCAPSISTTGTVIRSKLKAIPKLSTFQPDVSTTGHGKLYHI